MEIPSFVQRPEGVFEDRGWTDPRRYALSGQYTDSYTGGPYECLETIHNDSTESVKVWWGNVYHDWMILKNQTLLPGMTTPARVMVTGARHTVCVQFTRAVWRTKEFREALCKEKVAPKKEGDLLTVLVSEILGRQHTDPYEASALIPVGATEPKSSSLEDDELAVGAVLPHVTPPPADDFKSFFKQLFDDPKKPPRTVAPKTTTAQRPRPSPPPTPEPDPPPTPEPDLSLPSTPPPLSPSTPPLLQPSSSPTSSHQDPSAQTPNPPDSLLRSLNSTVVKQGNEDLDLVVDVDLEGRRMDKQAGADVDVEDAGRSAWLYVFPCLFAVAFFVLALMGLKTFHSFCKPVLGWQDPLMHKL